MKIRTKPADNPRIPKTYRLKRKTISEIARLALIFQQGESELLEGMVAELTNEHPPFKRNKKQK